ncbi:tubby C-terminal-like domain-containing protein [Triangularia verruculosa]|uniref:Tubby C-terminal-like domain-containing protein n=1 Tax=Triangularia verruculosa TaxID=2587418 RepID=A0AAN6XHV9_9PEZI|nr:tubby C-terminal-like domain-containing protein [Triangularia verruculosa]
MAYQLPPLAQPIAIFDQFIARQTETLVIKEKLLDSFDIKTHTGQPVLRVQGQLLSMRGRKTVTDLGGAHLFDIVKEMLHIHATFVANSQAGEKLLEVKSSFALVGSKARATFTNRRTGQPVILFMKGNWFDTSADIVDETTGAVVARIDRKLLNMREAFLGQQTYHLTVAPGADMAVLVAMCIALDEKNNEGEGGFCTVM